MSKQSHMFGSQWRALLGGQEKYLFWGFCQAWRWGCQREVRRGGGQMCPRPCQRPRWPQWISPLTRAITLVQAQNVPVPRLDHGKAIPCGLFSLIIYSTPHSHLQPRITGQPVPVNMRMLLFIFFSLEHIKITLPGPNIHVNAHEAGLQHVCMSRPKQSHMGLLKWSVFYVASGCLLQSQGC